MKRSDYDNLASTAALVFAITLAAAYFSGLLVGHVPWPVRTTLLAAGLATAGGLLLLTQRRWRRSQQAVERHLDALCTFLPRDLVSESSAAEIPPLPLGNPLAAVACRVREAFLENCRRLNELETSRTALEVRCRRAATQAAQLRTIFSKLSQPVLAIDHYDELVVANRSATELLHIDTNGVERRALAQLVHCQKLVDLLGAVSRRATSNSRSEEIEIVDPQGQSRWYRAMATTLTRTEEEGGDSAAGARGAVVTLHEVGDQRTAQKRNAEFVSAVSHEIKTPLAGIKAYVELLVDGDAEDQATREEFLGVINSQVDRLQRLVDNMLCLARIEAGVTNVNKQTRSLNELLEEALRVVQPAAEAKGIRLVSELSPMYLSVLADRDMLLQAAINLLSNAIKYTQERGCVTLRSRTQDDWVRFEVEDTGVGLSEEDRQRVFEKFYRVQKDREMASGTGLGLPLAKHIVEDVHRGQLTVESILGRGSTFIVALPSAGQMT